MAQGVTLMGASYSDVPGVELPKTGGGTAAFFDVSGTTASAEDVAKNKIFVSVNGTITIGTAEGETMTVLSYGSSTWAEFLAAFQSNTIVYCKASSNSNPGTGSQGRMAFMAFVSYSGTTPTSVEFQYYRSVSSHTESQQGDQVFVYKLENSGTSGTWSVTTREASTKIVAGTGLGSSYSSGTLTLNNSNPLPSVTSTDNGKVLKVVNGAWSAESLPSASGVSF